MGGITWKSIHLQKLKNGKELKEALKYLENGKQLFNHIRSLT
jgi:hypothetical protein